MEPAGFASTTTATSALALPASAFTDAPLAEIGDTQPYPAPESNGANLPTQPRQLRPQPATSDLAAGLPPSVTPLIAPQRKALLQGHPDRFRADFVADGLFHGFRIGLLGQFTPSSSPNLPSALLQPELVRSHLEECVERGETVGPFPNPPLPPPSVSSRRKMASFASFTICRLLWARALTTG